MASSPRPTRAPTRRGVCGQAMPVPLTRSTSSGPESRKTAWGGVSARAFNEKLNPVYAGLKAGSACLSQGASGAEACGQAALAVTATAAAAAGGAGAAGALRPASSSATRGTSFLDDATAPIGSRRSPIEIAPGTNSPATIGGRRFTGHALDRMQGRGIMPSVVDDAIRNNTAIQGADGSFIHYSPTNNISVVLNADGSVRTVSYGVFKPR